MRAKALTRGSARACRNVLGEQGQGMLGNSESAGNLDKNLDNFNMEALRTQKRLRFVVIGAGNVRSY